MTKLPKTPNPCLGAAITTQEFPYDNYACHLPFTPSNKALQRYAAFKGQDVVLNYTKYPPSITFNDDAIKTLTKKYPKDPLYPLLTQFRELEKVKGTYIGGTTPEADGRYREEFKHTPKTLRLAMRILQLLPRVEDRKDEGEGEDFLSQIKSFFVAAPGKTYHARDFSGIELQLVAYFAGDAGLLRLSKIDSHSYIASHAIGQPADLKWSDADLKAYLNQFKKEDRQWEVGLEGEKVKRSFNTIRTACKRVTYLSMYLGTPMRMMQVEPELFPDVKTGTYYQGLFFETFPSINKWHWATLSEAETNGFLLCPSGFRLWCVDSPFKYTFQPAEGNAPGRWTKEFGENAKEIVAAKPQHTAFLFSARAIKKAYANPEMRDSLRLSIHDEIFSEVDIERVREYDTLMKAYMETPAPDMPLDPAWGMGSHLVIETEAKVGTRWSTMGKYKEAA